MKTQENKTKARQRTCEYCQEKEAEGYIPQLNAWVCEDCYEDNHGLPL